MITLLISCSGSSEKDFKRVSEETRQIIKKKPLEKFRIHHYKNQQADYFFSESEGATYKGSLMMLAGKDQQLSFNPQLEGNYRLFIEFLLLIKKPINFSLHHNQIKVLESYYTKNGTYFLSLNLQLNRRDKLKIHADGWGAILLGNPIFYKVREPAQRTHIFLICADTLRADHLPLYGYHRQTAENIERFSRDSVVFKNAYSQAPWTLPSHMSLFTSLYEYNHGVMRNRSLSEDVQFLIEQLSNTFLARSINGGGFVDADYGFYRGFDYYKSYGGKCGGTNPDSAKNLFKTAMRDIQNTQFPKVFYFLQSYQIHYPYFPRKRFLNYFKTNPIYERIDYPPHLIRKASSKQEIKEIKRASIDLYDGEIRSFDHWFGAFLDFLKQKNLYHSSMIIFISDHGEEFWDHKRWGHGHSVYNELIKVPIIIKFPHGEYKGKIINETTGLIDILPTIFHYFSMDLPESNHRLDGENLIPLIRGKAIDRVLFSSNVTGIFNRIKTLKIAAIFNQGKIRFHIPIKISKSPNQSHYANFEFYDLKEDIGETNNLYSEKESYIQKFEGLFQTVIKKARYNLNRKGNQLRLNKELRKHLKTLGYL